MIHDQSTTRGKALSWLAPLITAAICAAGVSLLLNRTPRNGAAPALAEAGRLAALEAQLQRSNAALHRLEQLQLVQTAAAEHAATVDATPTTSKEQTSADEPPSDEPAPTSEDTQAVPYPEEREKAFFNAYFRELGLAMSQQRADRQLAARLTPLVPGVDRGLVQVLDLSCTEQLCRLEARYQHPDRASRDRFIQDLQTAFAPELTRASIHLPTDENRLLGYFARRGATLPRPTTSFATFMRGDEG